MVKYGISGLGKISHKFFEDTKDTTNSVIYGVSSSVFDRALNYRSDEYIPLRSTYIDMAHDPNIECVYVSTLTSDHIKLTKLFLENKKSVICEKPLGCSYKETLEMVECARENKVLLMEALWSRFIPSIVELIKITKEKKYGNIIEIDGHFERLFPDGHRVLNRSTGGGVALDIGIYLYSLTYYLLGYPKSIEVSGKTEFDVDVEVITTFNYDNCKAKLSCSAISEVSNLDYVIKYENATLTLPNFHFANKIIVNENSKITELNFKEPSFSYEIEHFSSLYKEHKLESDLYSLDQTLDVAKIITYILEKLGVSY